MMKMAFERTILRPRISSATPVFAAGLVGVGVAVILAYRSNLFMEGRMKSTSFRDSSVSNNSSSTVSTGSGSMASSGDKDRPKTFSRALNWVTLRLDSAEQVNHDTKRLRFALPDPNSCSGINPSSALLSISWPKGRIFPVPRPYTPVSDPDEPGYLSFLIKHYPNGAASSHMHSLTPGDTVSFAGPLPGFKWSANLHPRVALIAGGAGITPIYSLLQRILKDPADTTRVTLVWGVNSDQDAFLKEEFDGLARRFPGRFEVSYVVSRPQEGSEMRKGYVTKELLQELGLEGSEDRETKVFVCGPPAMENALVGKRGKGGILEELGYASGQVHKF